MWNQSLLFLLAASSLTAAQRGSYAGRRPVGYPMITTTTVAAPLADRFGQDGNTTPSTTTVRLPPEALGDRELFDRLNKLPVDKQPFWLLNWQALEANRNNPQSYVPNENSFVDRFSTANSQSNSIVSQFRSNVNDENSADNTNTNQENERVRDNEANRASRQLDSATNWRKEVRSRNVVSRHNKV